MTVLDVITEPDPRLHMVSEPVEQVDDELRGLMDDMLETMYASQGIGLAAIQVGVPKRVLVMDIGHSQSRYEESGEANAEPMFLVNPEIVESSEEVQTFKEGCLSFPGQYADVKRPEEVTVKYLDYEGEEQVMHASGIMAVCVQHEIDHLNGVVFVDYLSRLKREMILRRLKKQKKPA